MTHEVRMLTMNRSIITRSTNTPGQKIHTAQGEEFLMLTLQKIDSFDFVNIGDPNAEVVKVKLTIGEDAHSFLYEFPKHDQSFQIRNIPMYENEEAWIATDITNMYCAHGFTTKQPILSSNQI